MACRELQATQIVASIFQNAPGIEGGGRLNACVKIYRDVPTGWVAKDYRLDDLLDGRDAVVKRMEQISMHSNAHPPVVIWNLDESAGSLQRRTRRLSRVQRRPTLKDFRALAKSLDDAHVAGLIHGDINRKNVILTDDACALIDWEPSLSQEVSGRVTMMATRPYIHPADLAQGTITKRTDLYCYGAYMLGHLVGFDVVRRKAFARDEALLQFADAPTAAALYDRFSMAWPTAGSVTAMSAPVSAIAGTQRD
jgi:hypothetical protein